MTATPGRLGQWYTGNKGRELDSIHAESGTASQMGGQNPGTDRAAPGVNTSPHMVSATASINLTYTYPLRATL